MPTYGNVIPAFKRLGECILCLPVMFLFASQFKQEFLYDPEYAKHNMLFKVYYLLGCMHVTIFRLFFAFGTLETNMIASGVSYSAPNKNKPEEYNSIRNVNMMGFQF